MLAFHYLEEAYEQLRQHKLRSSLTGFGVAWGIFLLVLLLGVGEGFYRGVYRQFSGYAQNNMWFWGGQRVAGDYIRFTAPLLNKLQNSIAGIACITPVYREFGPSLLNYLGEDYNNASLKGVGISYDQVGQLVLGQGRFLNSRDEAFTRPVCVIGNDIQSTLFKSKNPIGKFISINGQYFQVVGTLDKEAAFNREEQKAVLMPSNTFRKTFNKHTGFQHFRLSLQPQAVASTVENKVRTYLAEQLCFDKADRRTLYVFNLGKQAQSFDKLFHGVRLFLWVVGGCMLLSGVIGVSNMMLVLVKERTQEIGIRKVLGASTQEILLMVLSEAILISLAAGTVGMLAGVGSIYGLNRLLDYVDPSQQLLIAHLAFKPSTAITALILLVIAGATAGLVPARRATKILPIKALTSE